METMGLLTEVNWSVPLAKRKLKEITSGFRKYKLNSDGVKLQRKARLQRRRYWRREIQYVRTGIFDCMTEVSCHRVLTLVNGGTWANDEVWYANWTFCHRSLNIIVPGKGSLTLLFPYYLFLFHFLL